VPTETFLLFVIVCRRSRGSWAWKKSAQFKRDQRTALLKVAILARSLAVVVCPPYSRSGVSRRPKGLPARGAARCASRGRQAMAGGQQKCVSAGG